MCNCTDKVQCRKHEITAIRISLHNENKFHGENAKKPKKQKIHAPATGGYMTYFDEFH